MDTSQPASMPVTTGSSQDLSTLQSAAQAAVSNTIAIVDTAAADTDAQVAKRRKYNKKFTSDAETKPREREKRERISECFLALGTLVGSPFADQLTILLRACEGLKYQAQRIQLFETALGVPVTMRNMHISALLKTMQVPTATEEQISASATPAVAAASAVNSAKPVAEPATAPALAKFVRISVPSNTSDVGASSTTTMPSSLAAPSAPVNALPSAASNMPNQFMMRGATASQLLPPPFPTNSATIPLSAPSMPPQAPSTAAAVAQMSRMPMSMPMFMPTQNAMPGFPMFNPALMRVPPPSVTTSSGADSLPGSRPGVSDITPAPASSTPSLPSFPVSSSAPSTAAPIPIVPMVPLSNLSLSITSLPGVFARANPAPAPPTQPQT